MFTCTHGMYTPHGGVVCINLDTVVYYAVVYLADTGLLVITGVNYMQHQ